MVRHLASAAVLSCVLLGCGGPQDPDNPPMNPRAVVRTDDEQKQYSGCLLGRIDDVIYDCFPTGDPRRAIAVDPGAELVVELRDANAEDLAATVVSNDDDSLFTELEVSGSNREWNVQLPKTLPRRPYLQLSAKLESFSGGIHAFRVELQAEAAFRRKQEPDPP